MSQALPWTLVGHEGSDPTGNNGTPQQAEEVFCPAVPLGQRSALEAQVYVMDALREAMRQRARPSRRFEASEHMHTAVRALEVLQDAERGNKDYDEAGWRCAHADVQGHLSHLGDSLLDGGRLS